MFVVDKYSIKKFLPKAGFTLVEMMLVMGIIAILLSSAIFLLKGTNETARINQVDADLKTYEAALTSYKLLAKKYPAQNEGLQALVTRPANVKRWTQQMKSLKADPWGVDYIYLYPGTKDKREPELISIGPDGERGTEDDMSSQDS